MGFLGPRIEYPPGGNGDARSGKATNGKVSNGRGTPRKGVERPDQAKRARGETT